MNEYALVVRFLSLFGQLEYFSLEKGFSTQGKRLRLDGTKSGLDVKLNLPRFPLMTIQASRCASGYLAIGKKTDGSKYSLETVHQQFHQARHGERDDPQKYVIVLHAPVLILSRRNMSSCFSAISTDLRQNWLLLRLFRTIKI